jgi:hypothetical protein
MRSLALTASLLLASTALAAEPTCLALTSHGLGPIELGMTRAQVDALKLPTEVRPLRVPLQTTTTVFQPKPSPGETGYGNLMIRFTGGKVTGIRLDDNQGCVSANARKISLADPGALIAAQVGSCGPVNNNIGGNAIYCEGGHVTLTFKEMGGVEYRGVHVSVDPKNAPAASCAGYLEPGALVATASVSGKPGSSIEVVPGKSYCLPGTTVDSTLVPEAIRALGFNTCSRLGEVVACDYQGARFHFERGALVKLQVVARKAPHSGPIGGESLE